MKLSERMKAYEKVSDNKLMKRTPVLIRLDMKGGSKFCKRFETSFDKTMLECMQETMRGLVENIQNCVYGYTQSDEITLVLLDTKNLETDCWFGNRIQKMVSISASMASVMFNTFYRDKLTAKEKMSNKFLDLLLVFDSRVFNLPFEEIINNLVWRQQDAERNSLNSLCQSVFSFKELQGKKASQLNDMLHEKGMNWNDLDTCFKRGTECFKEDGKIKINFEMPILSKNREHLQSIIDNNRM